MTDNATPHRATEYDSSVRKTIPFYETIQREAVDLVLAVRPDVRFWLDTGCGTGFLVELALPRFPQTRFVAADPSPGMLELARERLATVGGDRVRFLEPAGSAGLAGGIGEERPQVITAVMCHHYLGPEGRREATRACFDLLESGGLFVTFENVTPRTDRGVEIGLERWRRFQVEMGRSEATVARHLTRFGTEYFPITVGNHLRLLEETGFRTVELVWRSQMQAGLYAIK
jgi:tRNA (cmo5U34)-methyltransferase